jgi:hypothetical protein
VCKDDVRFDQCAEGILRKIMGSIGKDNTIQVKSKCVAHVKYLAETDPVLSAALQLNLVEDHDYENEPFAYFRVKFKEDLPSRFTVSEIQVIIALFYPETYTCIALEKYLPPNYSTLITLFL